MAKGIQEKSADTIIVENRLRNTQPGDLVTYNELSTLLGRDVREFCIGYVQTARKTLIGESVFFDTVKSEGYLRLDVEQSCKVVSSYITRAKKTAGRGLRHLAHVEFAKLSDDGKRHHLTSSAQLGAMKLFSSGKAAKRIGTQVTPDMATTLAIGETLKLFGGGDNGKQQDATGQDSA